MRTARRGALAVVTLLGTLVGPAAGLANADSSPGRDPLDRSAAVAALVADGGASSTTRIERADVLRAAVAHAESIVGISDPLGDALFPQGDLTATGANANADGITTVVAMVSSFETPLSASWQFRDTGLLWGFDLDGDGTEDLSALMINWDGHVIGGILDHANRVVCDAVPYWDASRRVYGLGFPTDCLGDPQEFRFYASLEYIDYTTGIDSLDEAPDTTWSVPVANDAVGSSTVFYTACQPAGLSAPDDADVAFQPIDPVRLLDTRSGMSTIDCFANGVGAIEGGTEYHLAVGNRAGIPAAAGAVALNVTVTGASGPGFLTVYPCGQTRPLASNLNFTAGATVANAAVVKLGTAGEVCVFSSAHADVVVDANGWFGTVSSFWSTMPTRVLDTRGGLGVRPAGSIAEIAVGAPTGTSAPVTSVMLNVTVADPAAAGYVTVFPCGSATPLASNLNFVAGQTVANAVVAKVGPAGTVCLFTSAPTQLVADLSGWFTGGTDFVPLSPARLLDSRPGLATIDGEASGAGTRAGGTVTEVQVTGRGGVPTDATAVVLNVTVTDAGGAGYLTVFPCGAAQPNASNLNFTAGGTRANAVVAKIGSGGRVCFVSNVDTDLVVDVNGYHT